MLTLTVCVFKRWVKSSVTKRRSLASLLQTQGKLSSNLINSTYKRGVTSLHMRNYCACVSPHTAVVGFCVTIVLTGIIFVSGTIWKLHVTNIIQLGNTLVFTLLILNFLFLGIVIPERSATAIGFTGPLWNYQLYKPTYRHRPIGGEKLWKVVTSRSI